MGARMIVACLCREADATVGMRVRGDLVAVGVRSNGVSGRVSLPKLPWWVRLW